MIAVLLAAALAAQEPALPPSRWLRVRTPVGELITDADPEAARRAALRLQRFAQVLAAAAPAAPLDTRQAVILAFADADSFAGLRPGRGGRAFEVDGFVQGGPARTLVAVNLASERADPLETLDHEYVHLALNGALPAQPAWLAEGLAELLSGWSEDEAGVLVGLARPAHARLLRERGLLPVDGLLAAGYTSPEFTDPEKRPLFYAQSWALARKLMEGGDPAAARRLLDFLSALAKGTPPGSAFERSFGLEPAAVPAWLSRSLEAGPPPVRLALPPPPAVTDTVAEAAPAGLAQSLIGELLLRQERDAEAQRRFEGALREDPNLAAAHEGLAQVALRRGRWQDARRHLDAALQRQPGQPGARHRMAELLVREAGARGEVLSGEAEATAVRLLEEAVALAPRYGDAVDLLTHLRPEPRAERIRMLERALAHDPGRADLLFTLAGLHLGGQDPQAAAAVLVRARDGARNETHRFLAEHMLRRLGEATAGTAETRGRLLALDCRPGGALDFVVEAVPGAVSGGLELVMRGRTSAPRSAAPSPLRLRASSPSSVLLQDGAGELLQRELVCGPQQGTVRVRYRPLADPPPDGPHVDGVLLTLRFLSR